MEIIFLKENENEICRMNAGSENVFTAKAQKGRMIKDLEMLFDLSIHMP